MKNKVNKKSNGVNKRKMFIILAFTILCAIIFFIFFKNVYKNKNIGNNMSNKNIEEIEKYILNISSYRARVDVTIESNKNQNKYLMEQIYKKDQLSKQTILEPSNIEGLEMKYESGTLTITNSKLKLTTVYDNYTNLVENFLWIDTFIKDYIEGKNNNASTIIEENDVIIMQTKTRNEKNKYIYYKKMYIDRKTGKPTKLYIEDINKKNIVYILYNEITVNGLQ